jgi:spore photoproduct lyase
MKRHQDEKRVRIAKNANEILTHINNHVTWLPEKTPNQTDEKYYTYDLACNEDFALHSKYHNWEMIFDFFRKHDRAKGSLATKIIPIDFLNFDAEKKIRIRFSLMPQRISSQLEPKTPSILDRVKAIDAFIDAGYEVHVNYSPVVVYDNWIEDYDELFSYMNDYVDYKDEVKSEVIFLTHNEEKHIRNLSVNKGGEELLWTPEIQEAKTSQYGGSNIRYKRNLKSAYIQQFKDLHSKTIPWNTIRYIF